MASGVGYRFTDTRHGDLRVQGDPTRLRAHRSAIRPGAWTWLRQVHGGRVVVVTEPGEHAGAEADAAVTLCADAPVAVHTADCAPVLFLADGAVGVAHAGWRGLAAGVLEATVETMTALGAPPVEAVLGPCIRPRCYEFGADDLQQVAEAVGPEVRGLTAWGTPALDLPAGVAAACGRLGVPVTDLGTCTACSPVHWSHRARGEAGRQALVAWVEP